VEEGVRLLGACEGAVAGRGHARLDEQLLHPRLGPLQACAVGTRPEHEPPRGTQSVGEPVDERGLRADHEQVGLDLLRRRRHRARDARVAGRHHHLGAAPEHVGERVLAATAADDADLHDDGGSTRSTTSKESNDEPVATGPCPPPVWPPPGWPPDAAAAPPAFAWPFAKSWLPSHAW